MAASGIFSGVRVIELAPPATDTPFNAGQEAMNTSMLMNADAVARVEGAIRRPVDVVIVNTGRPAATVLASYGAEHKEPLQLGNIPAHCEVVTGEFWTGEIARHDRLRLAYALWTVLSRRLLV